MSSRKELSSPRLLALIGFVTAIFVAGTIFLAIPAHAQSYPGDPREEALFGTWTSTPSSYGHLNPVVNQYTPNSGAGVVVTFPANQPNPLSPYLDTKTLRTQRLTALAEQVAGIMYRIHFDFDKTNLDLEAREAISDLAALLSANPDIGVALDGHTDLVGSDEYNDSLSRRRAYAVLGALSSYGFDVSRLHAQWHGETFTVVLTLLPSRGNRHAEGELVDLFALPSTK